MRIFDLPLASFLVLIAIPWAIILFQFYYCWRVYKQSRELKKRREQ